MQVSSNMSEMFGNCEQTSGRQLDTGTDSELAILGLLHNFRVMPALGDTAETRSAPQTV